MTDFTAIGSLVTKAQDLLDRIKGGAIRVMETQFDALMSNSTTSINSFLTQKRSEFSNVLSTVETKAFPYVNLFENSYANNKDENGEYIFPISTYGLAELEEVLPFDSELVPASVREEYAKIFKDQHQYRPNIIHVRFSDGVLPMYWLPGNPVIGRYSLGFAFAYVFRGSMRGIEAGQAGSCIQHRERSSWNIDGEYSAEKGLDVYLALPFVVAGYCPSASLVSTIPSQATKLALNVG